VRDGLNDNVSNPIYIPIPVIDADLTSQQGEGETAVKMLQNFHSIHIGKGNM